MCFLNFDLGGGGLQPSSPPPLGAPLLYATILSQSRTYYINFSIWCNYNKLKCKVILVPTYGVVEVYDPRILNLGTGRRYCFRCPFDGGLGASQSRSWERQRSEKISVPIRNQTPGIQPVVQCLYFLSCTGETSIVKSLCTPWRRKRSVGTTPFNLNVLSG
jgi:hypothetical protein